MTHVWNEMQHFKVGLHGLNTGSRYSENLLNLVWVHAEAYLLMAIHDVHNQEAQNWAFPEVQSGSDESETTAYTSKPFNVSPKEKNTHDTLRSKQICVDGEGLIFLKCRGLQIYCFGAAFR